ncbi:hypothetical protein MBLNU459_g2640t2 [Dothideomycetes sp. NU459]
MAEPIQDVSPWLVTAENPPRSGADLDYKRCAALHNHILESGWLASGRTLDELVAERRTWFQAHGEDAEEARGNLSEGLIEFLNRAYVIDSSTHKFFFWSDSLSDPDELWENQNPDLQEEGDEHRFVTLYPVNTQQSEHGDGLNYDQKKNRAIMQMDILDDEVTRREDDPPPWHPLETVLSAWIEMMHAGKVTASPKSIRPINEKYDPWANQRFSQAQVDEAVKAFERLAGAIESRMPPPVDPSPKSTSLVESEILDRANIPADSFAYAFCSKARRPRFGSIAPGISLLTAETFISDQAFSASDADGEGSYVAPTLLFRAPDRSCTLGENEYPFAWAFRHIKTLPAGLYLTGADLGDENVSEASARVLLPFSVGDDDGHARKSDRSRFANASDLYQLGLPPFGGHPRSQRFVKILENWLAMVEGGNWRVGDQGVEGAIEDFRRADTEQSWEQFYVAPTW